MNPNLKKRALKKWLDNEMIFYEDLNYKESDEKMKKSHEKISVIEKRRNSKLTRIINLPDALIQLISAYEVDIFEWSTLSSPSRKIYVHFPQNWNKDTLIQDIRDKFIEWWGELYAKKYCKFSFDCENFPCLHLEKSIEPLEWYLGIDDESSVNTFQYPMSNENAVFENILRHEKIPISWNPRSTSQVHFDVSCQSRIKTVDTNSSAGNSYSKITEFALDAGLCKKIEPFNLQEKLSAKIHFANKLDIRNFMTNLGRGIENIDLVEGLMLMPGLYIRSLNNQSVWIIGPCPEGHGYCGHCSTVHGVLL